MPYGEIRVDTITFTNGGADTSITVSGLAASTTGNLTVTGTVSGTTATFVTGVFTSSISGAVITTQSGIIASGTAGNPSLSFIGDANTGLYSPGADQVAISTNGAQRVAVDASGNVAFDTNTLYVDAVNNRVSIGTANSVGKLTVATSSADPSSALSAWSDGYLVVTPGGTTTSGGIGLSFNTSTNIGGISCAAPGSAWRDLIYKASAHRFELGGSEAARIDSSGRLLVGTSTSRTTAFGQPVHQIEGGSSNGFSSITVAENTQFGGAFILAKTRGSAFQAVTSGDNLGILSFQGANGSALLEGARIEAGIDGTVSGGGANDLPTRLVFSTTADGASSPTERMRIDSSGRLLVGTSSARGGFGGDATVFPGIQLEGTGAYNDPRRFMSLVHNSANSFAPFLYLGKTRGTSNGAVTAVQVNDELGSIAFMGADGTDLKSAALIQSFVDGTPGSNDMPGRLVFSTTADGASSPTERMRIDSSGRLLVGTTTADTSGNALLQVNGSIKGTVTSETSKATTSGTAVEFTGIPSWVKKITLMLNGISLSGNGQFLIQLGSGSFKTSDYVSTGNFLSGGVTSGGASSTAGFLLYNNFSENIQSGHIVFTLQTGNTWIGSGVTTFHNFVTNGFTAGNVTLSGALDRIRLTSTDTATNNLDAGSINILYEG